MSDSSASRAYLKAVVHTGAECVVCGVICLFIGLNVKPISHSSHCLPLFVPFQVVKVFNSQFDVEGHVSQALEALKAAK